MANGVYYVARGIELNLTEPDLGHPELPNLLDEVYPGYVPGRLQCLQCRESDPDCPQWMHIKMRDGRPHAAHKSLGIGDHGGESDAHKALKERIANTATAAGFEAVVEDRAKHGRRITDVLVKGPTVKLGCEAQMSYITAGTVRRRTAIARRDGITSLWTTHDRKAQLINVAPWARIDRMPWQQYASAAELPVRGGVRSLTMERCERLGTVCPDRKAGRPCSGWHPQWEAIQQRFDDLIVGAAAGEWVPYGDVVGDRVVRWFWVTATDYTKVAAPVVGQAAARVGTPMPELGPAVPQEIDPTCRYGENDWGGTGQSRDDSSPIAARIVVPMSRGGGQQMKVLAGVCNRGGGPCANEARLYPGGWACDDHKPRYTSHRGNVRA